MDIGPTSGADASERSRVPSLMNQAIEARETELVNMINNATSAYGEVDT